MEAIKSVIWGPDPKVQMRKCNASLRKSSRDLDRNISRAKQSENSARARIIQESKRAQRNPSQAKAAANATRLFAKELVMARKQTARLTTSKAQLESVKMQVNEAFSVRIIEGSLKSSTKIMKDVNTLVKLPELSKTMQELSQELMKAGVIDEMVGDMLPGQELMEDEDEEVETEIDKVLGEVLKTPTLPDTQIGITPTPAEDVSEDQEATLAQMRGRLEALKS